jgi:hypothetical protein
MEPAMNASDHQPFTTGETRAKKCENRQGGGFNSLLSGGDERSEPESQIENLPIVSETQAPPLPCLSIDV